MAIENKSFIGGSGLVGVVSIPPPIPVINIPDPHIVFSDVEVSTSHEFNSYVEYFLRPDIEVFTSEAVEISSFTEVEYIDNVVNKPPPPIHDVGAKILRTFAKPTYEGGWVFSAIRPIESVEIVAVIESGESPPFVMGTSVVIHGVIKPETDGILLYPESNHGNGWITSNIPSNTISLNGDASENAQYRFRGYNGIGTVYSDVVDIEFFDDMEVSISSGEIIDRPGSDHTISVSATGSYDIVSYEWFRGGVSVGVNSNQLVILDSTIGDRGDYHCELTNEIGITKSTSVCEVIITEFDVAISADKIPAHIGETTTVLCTPMNSIGMVSYQWFIDGIAVFGASGNTLLYTPDTDGTVSVHCVVSDDDISIKSGQIDISAVDPNQSTPTTADVPVTSYRGKFDYNLKDGTDIGGIINSDAIDTTRISITERLNNFQDLRDPFLIDEELMGLFASDLGYDIDIGFNYAYSSSELAKDDIIKNIRNVLKSLPHWYKIKSTSSAIKIMLFSFGLVSDYVALYSSDYSDDFVTEADALGGANSNKAPAYYPTPHFFVKVDYEHSGVFGDTDEEVNNASFMTASQDFSKRLKLAVEVIESIKPMNAVLNGVSASIEKNMLDDQAINMNIGVTFRNYIGSAAENFTFDVSPSEGLGL